MSANLKHNLRIARERAGLKQEEVAERLEVRRPTVSNWEREGGSTPSEAYLEKLAKLYGWTVQELRFGKVRIVSEPNYDAHRSVEQMESAARASRARRRLPPGAYARVISYLEQLEAKGVPAPGVDEAERLMTDAAFNKLNARDPRERSEEELLMDIDDAFDFIRSVLRRKGFKL